LNECGEVAEGARSNIFVERDGVLLTPPIESGALPGVLRADLLARGQARSGVAAGRSGGRLLDGQCAAWLDSRHAALAFRFWPILADFSG
jgi:hypothetical protein